MVHKREKKWEWLRTTDIQGQEHDIYKVGNKVVAIDTDSDKITRIWEKQKDFKLFMQLQGLVF